MKDQVQVWIEKAESDLGAGKVLLEHEFYEQVAFWAEQAAEKAVKALYMHDRGQAAPKTHRVDKLAEELGLPEELLGPSMDLTGDYMITRYPGEAGLYDVPVYSRVIAEDRLNGAQAILDYVRGRLSGA